MPLLYRAAPRAVCAAPVPVPLVAARQRVASHDRHGPSLASASGDAEAALEPLPVERSLSKRRTAGAANTVLSSITNTVVDATAVRTMHDEHR